MWTAFSLDIFLFRVVFDAIKISGLASMEFLLFRHRRSAPRDREGTSQPGGLLLRKCSAGSLFAGTRRGRGAAADDVQSRSQDHGWSPGDSPASYLD